MIRGAFFSGDYRDGGVLRMAPAAPQGSLD